MRQWLAYLTALTVVLATGLVHGLWTQRWSNGGDLGAARARLEHVPLTLGDWHGTALELDAATLARAEVAGYFWRRYLHQGDGRTVTALVLCGRFGPLSVHTPEVCYGAIGFQPMEPPQRVAVPLGPSDKPAEVWTARFEKQGPVPEYLRVFWGWSAGDGWQAPDNPRFTFRAAPVLYKLYVVREMARPDEPLDGDGGVALLRRLVPVLDAAFAGPERGTGNE
jgi:hypothetical protein